MQATAKCRSCGSDIGSGAPFGHCPKCLLAHGFVDEKLASERVAAASEWRIGDYELLEQIGRGGMGAVYRARQIGLNREVAFKMILPAESTRPEAIKRFQVEAEAAAKLQHPNIVPIYEFGREGGQYYFTMQLIEGMNLNQCLARFQLPVASSIASKAEAKQAQIRIVRLLRGVACAVHFAHDRGVLHRDLKPQNILITTSGEPFLTDFGLAKILDDTGTHSSELTTVLGTLNYMSPEQATGARVGPATDVFSLGAILYELLTHTPPFRGVTAAETSRRIAESEPVPPQSINGWVDADLAVICLKCLQKSPPERYATARDLAEDLELWLRDEPIRARPVSLPIRARRWVRRNRAVTALMVALAVGLLTAVSFYFHAAHQVRDRKAVETALRAQIGDILGRMSLPRKYVEILSGVLAPLRGRRTSTSRPHEHFTLGVGVFQNHMATVLQYADLVNYLESEMEQELHRPVRIDLRLYDEIPTDAARVDRTDFLRVSPWLYTEACRSGEKLRVIVSPRRSSFRSVIIAHVTNKLARLSDLPGHSLAFGERQSIITLSGKALLVQNGIFKKQLSACTYIEPKQVGEFIQGGYLSTSGDPLNGVFNGRCDAAVVTEIQLQQSQHRTSFVILTNFPCMDNFWVATTNIAPEKVEAFRRAMNRLSDSVVLNGLPESPTQPRGFVDASPSDVEALAEARAAAERFDSVETDKAVSSTNAPADNKAIGGSK